MKILLSHILFFLLLGCSSYENEDCNKGYPEKHYEFLTDIKRVPDFDYLEAIIEFREFGSFSPNKWLRKTENLEQFYGSIREIGLKNFISVKEFNKPLFNNHWAETCWKNQSLNQILQNLIKSYSDTTRFDKYYIEFWNRRIKEQNENAVYSILLDINETYNETSSTLNKMEWVNDDKITKLLEFEIQLKHCDSINLKKVNIEYFKYLKSIGLHSSANNLIHYADEFYLLNSQNSDKDYLQIIESVEIDSVSCNDYWNWRQSAEWFNEIYDNGP